jgi:uncharacterized protein DUF4345
MTTQVLNRSLPGSASEGSSGLAVWVSRVVLFLPTLVMFLISIRYILDPSHAASPTGVNLSTPEALTDTRVVGGITLTMAFIIVTAIFSRRTLRMGHAVVVALMAFILAARMFGFVQDGTRLNMGTQKVKTAGEVVFLVLNAAGCLLQTSRTKCKRVTQ